MVVAVLFAEVKYISRWWKGER